MGHSYFLSSHLTWQAHTRGHVLYKSPLFPAFLRFIRSQLGKCWRSPPRKGASERKKGKLPSHQQEGAESNPEHDSQEESTLVKQ